MSSWLRSSALQPSAQEYAAVEHPNGLIINAKMLDTEVRIATAANVVTGSAAAEVRLLMDSTAGIIDIWQSFKAGPCKGQVALDDRKRCVAALKRPSGLLPGFDMAKVSPILCEGSRAKISLTSAAGGLRSRQPVFSYLSRPSAGTRGCPAWPAPWHREDPSPRAAAARRYAGGCPSGH